MARRATLAVADRRQGTPAEQLRADLSQLRAHDVPFDRAWEVAFRRIKWPHDTITRRAWKPILMAGRERWRECYEGAPTQLPVEAMAALAEEPVYA
jgi:hypothetical protein